MPRQRKARAPRAGAPVDPWAVLRATRDDDINGCDAVDELCVIRATLDAALARAPR